MTSSDKTQNDFSGSGVPEVVYVREVLASEVSTDSALQDASGETIAPDRILYAVHSADGERLAVMMDRETAFAAAVAHELDPVSVH